MDDLNYIIINPVTPKGKYMIARRGVGGKYGVVATASGENAELVLRSLRCLDATLKAKSLLGVFYASNKGA